MYINDEGLEVPKNKILFYKTEPEMQYDDSLSDAVESLIGYPTREWFTTPFSFCLPLTIANQYGFVVKATQDFELYWTGGKAPVTVSKKNPELNSVQNYFTNFGNGVLTIDNSFIFRTPPGINIMVMPPTNYYINGITPMFGVVETDNLRRTFTFNLKVTEPNKKIYIKKGDWLASFMPIPRYFVESFELDDATKYYSQKVLNNEIAEMNELVRQRYTPKEEGGDIGKPNDSGRRYFNGIYSDDKKFKDHQKRIIDKYSQWKNNLIG